MVERLKTMIVQVDEIIAFAECNENFLLAAELEDVRLYLDQMLAHSTDDRV